MIDPSLPVAVYQRLAAERGATITDVDGKLIRLVDDMFTTLYDSDNGIALAAPQIGISQRLLVYRVGSHITAPGIDVERLLNQAALGRPEGMQAKDDVLEARRLRAEGWGGQALHAAPFAMSLRRNIVGGHGPG